MKRIAIAMIVLALVACRKKPEPKPEAPAVTVGRESVATVALMRVESGPLLSGNLKALQSGTILAEVGGTITSVRGNPGDRVAKGTSLARIEDEAATANLRSAQVAVQSAQTSVTMADRDVDRMSMLAKAGAMPARDVDVARTQLSNAQAQLAAARAQLSSAQDRIANQAVEASLTGIISQRHASEGDIVTPGQPLFTIVDLTTLQLEASVPATALASLQVGAPVQFDVRGFEGQQFAGRVTRIAPAVDPGTGQAQIFVSVFNEGQRLVEGLFAEGSVATVAREGLVIPLTALDETGNDVAVTVLRNGVAQRQPVRLGVRNETRGTVEVVAGLNPGEQVLVGPARTITAGTKVTIGS